VVLINNSRDTFTPTASGAIATCLWELCRAAATEGVTPTVVTVPGEGDTYPWGRLRAVAPYVEPVNPYHRKLLGAERRLRGWARIGQHAYARQVAAAVAELRPATVVCNNDPEVAVHLRRTSPEVRVVHWFHNLELCSDGFRRRYAGDPGIATVAVSRYLARAIEATYQLEPLSVAVAHNGVDAELFHPATGARRPHPVIGFVGRIGVEKAPDTLIRACLALAATRSDFAVQLVGDTQFGPSTPTAFSAELGELVDELSAAGISVTRTGHLSRPEVPGALRSTDIQVVPSRWDEPCALTVLEGLATGLVVVASATGGNPELVGDAGALFPRDDVPFLADVLARLLDDPDRRSALATAARRRAEGFTWDATWRAVVGSP
jgi:glycosyltransferase involved in cell wall biosynthesis